MKRIILLDNNGETFDRFTFIDTKSGDMIGSSETGTGFFQYAGNVADNYMFTTFGYSWRKHCDVKKCTKNAIELFLSDCAHVGKERDINTISKDLKSKVIDYFN